MNLSYVKVYADWKKATEKLKDAEKGRLIDAMVVYATTGEDRSDALSGNEQYLFPMFQASIDRDRQELEDYIQKQSANGKKGGRGHKKATALEEKPKNPPLSEESQKSQEKEKEKDKDNIPPISPSKGDERFETFWKAYPRKTAKGAARKAFAKLKVTDELLTVMLDAIEAQKFSSQWRRDGGQYIPHPATWLNQARWEDEGDEVPFTDEPFEAEVPPPFDGDWERMYG